MWCLENEWGRFESPCVECFSTAFESDDMRPYADALCCESTNKQPCFLMMCNCSAWIVFLFCCCGLAISVKEREPFVCLSVAILDLETKSCPYSKRRKTRKFLRARHNNEVFYNRRFLEIVVIYVTFYYLTFLWPAGSLLTIFTSVVFLLKRFSAFFCTMITTKSRQPIHPWTPIVFPGESWYQDHCHLHWDGLGSLWIADENTSHECSCFGGLQLPFQDRPM